MSGIKPKDGVHVVDCRLMEPPGPMVAVLEAIELLKPDEKVLMVHRKDPVLIYERLVERNCDYELKTFIDGSIELLIWRKDK